jgi:hypothetical protein
MVRSAQFVHLSCVKISTISKRTETSFHLGLITKGYHWVCSKWFLSLWYIWRKPCTYLELRLVLSPNGSKRASTWASSPRSTIGCIQNDYLTYGMFGANRAHILSLWYIWRKPCTHLALALRPSLNGLKQDSTWATSPRSSIGCIQNDLWVYGTFSANHAPILLQD